MSDTPQNDSVDSEIIEQPVVETNDSISHSEGEGQVPVESEVQVDEVAVAQEKANAAFNKQYGEKKQLERDLASRDAKLQQFEQAERERQAAKVGTLPDFPDEFDDNFEEKKVAYVNALQQQANFNATNNVYLEQQQAEQLQQQQAVQVKAAKLQTDFFTNAKTAGATNQEFNDVISTLNGGGMTLQSATEIMSLGEDGYFIAKHLAGNAMAANEFNSLTPIQQGMKLVELKQIASTLKPKTSNAPAPVDSLQGTTSDFEAKQYKHIGGSEIEVGADW